VLDAVGLAERLAVHGVFVPPIPDPSGHLLRIVAGADAISRSSTLRAPTRPSSDGATSS
jgi:hypothetical protein